MTYYDQSKTYVQYCEDVLSGTEIAGKWIKLACKRFKDWFNNRDDIYFDYTDVDDKIAFISRFTLTEAPFTGHPFILLPYQQWIFANLFGFKYVSSNKRVIRNALLLMARKQGKTQLAAAILLASLIMDDQISVTGYTIANSGEQASLAFKHICDLCKSVDPAQEIFKRGKARIVKNIEIPVIESKIRVLNSDTSKLDGLNPQIFIQDEAHAAKTDDIWGVMKTGQGARHNALGIIISTTGWLVGDDYFLYSQWHACTKILEGIVEDDSWFSALYQIDDTDDWKDKSIWKKACPSLGVTIDYDIIEKDFNNAISNPSQEVQFKTKQLNMWCHSSKTWLTMEEIREVTQSFDFSIFDPEEEFSIVGCDIAYRSDLCVLTTLIEHKDKLWFKAFPFICERALEESKNKELYKKWKDKGYLQVIPGKALDLDVVINKLIELNNEFPVATVAYDPFQATQLCIKAQSEGMDIRPVRQSLAHFAEPTAQFETLVLNHRCVIDDNPVTRWCFSNVVIVEDSNGNRKPDKETPANKIDIVIAFIQSLKLYMEVKGLISNEELEAIVL